MDRVDRILLVLPILPAFDLLSTVFSLGSGGQEVGLLARPVLDNYGVYGLFPLAVSASVIFLVFMWVVIRLRRLLMEQWRFRWTRHLVMIPVFWIFVVEGVYVSTVIMNFMVSLSPAVSQILMLRIAVVGVYFLGVGTLARSHMGQIAGLKN